MSVHDFLRTYHLQLDFTSAVLPALCCDGDEFLMDALRTRGQRTSTDLQHLNACRLFLKVSQLSDIVSANGLFSGAMPYWAPLHRVTHPPQSGHGKAALRKIGGAYGETK